MPPPATVGTRVGPRLLAITLVLALLPSVLADVSPAHAATGVSFSGEGGGSFDYVEQAPPIEIGAGLQVVGGSFDGEYLEIAVDEATSHETLALLEAETPSADEGVVSVVAGDVFFGDGAEAVAVGSVDGEFDGREGRALRINFTSPFVNPSFEEEEEEGELGWTSLEQWINLGDTSIAGHTSLGTSDYPTDAPNDDDAPSWATFNVQTTTTGEPTQGSTALQLVSDMTTAGDCDVVHGPAVFSDPFDASAGDSIYFDWRAFSGSDAYHVFGYILDEVGTQTEVLNTYTSDTSGSTNWATKETSIPTDSSYRFVFVAGTYDASCGKAAGAQLLIDNVRVYGDKVNDAVVTGILQNLTYENSSDDPDGSRTIDVTAVSNDLGAASTEVVVEIEPVDDPPVLRPVDPVTLINTAADDTFADITGTLDASDPDSELTLGIDGVAGDPLEVVGDFSTLTLDPGTGDYTITPDDAAVDGQMTAASDTFTLTATDPDAVTGDAVTVQQQLTVDVAIDPSPPGAPDVTSARQSGRSVTLSWEPHPWIGGSPVESHTVEYSDDEGQTWVVLDEDLGVGTSVTVPSLSYGTVYTFRVRATNATGDGDWSEPSDAVRLRGPDPIPTPVPDEDGELAAPAPGTSGVTVGGEADGQATSTSTSHRASISGDGFEIEVWNADGGDEAVETGVGSVLRLPQGGDAGVRVDGFARHSTVRLWMFSEPRLLGEFRTDADGALSQGLAEVVADLDPCAHTLQAEGRLPDGRQVAAALGVWVVANPFPFSDVDSGGTHGPGIGCLEAHDIVEGYTAETFDETGGIARAQAASIVARSLQLEPGGTSPFVDVADGGHALAIAALEAAGIVQGTGDGRFEPWRTLTRGHAAAMLAAAAELTSDADTPYADTLDTTHERAIVALHEVGVIDGFEDGTFRADQPVTRGQFASLVARLLPLLPERTSPDA